LKRRGAETQRDSNVFAFFSASLRLSVEVFRVNPFMRRLGEFDALIAGGALLVMLLVPLLEIVLQEL
jgi:hypothetical protein